MTPAHAWRRLGLDPGASPADVDAAFRTISRVAHPDAGGDAVAFNELVEARRVARADAETWPCDRCKGRGRVAAGWGDLTCPACRGTGRKW